MVWLLVACAGAPPDDALWESKEPGWCSDDADNDGDGAFDCADPDCQGAQACADDSGDGLQDGTQDWDDLQEYARIWVDQGPMPGVAYAVVIDGELAYAGAQGAVQSGAAKALTPQTRMRWNSVSKLHVAMAVMQLVEDGTLDLDAPVTDWVPDLALDNADPDALTLSGLMRHTTALPDFWDTSCETALDAYWAGASPALHAPVGEFYNYSNAGWSLTGLVLENATGQPFLELMQDRVLDPAGMTTATFDVEETVASGDYTIGTDGTYFYTPDNNDCAYVRPAGWLHGSAVDLARMAEVHLAGGQGLLSQDSLTAMQTGVPTGSGSDYGYGMSSYTYRGERLVGHSGAGAGHLSSWVLAPDSGFAVVAVTNSTLASPSAITRRATELFLDLALQDAEDPSTDPATWDAYEGTYQDPEGVGEVDVALDQDKLYIRFNDGSNTWRRLYQYGHDQFYYSHEGYNYVRFQTGDQGRYVVHRYWVAADQARAAKPPPRDHVLALEASSALDVPLDPEWPQWD